MTFCLDLELSGFGFSGLGVFKAHVTLGMGWKTERLITQLVMTAKVKHCHQSPRKDGWGLGSLDAGKYLGVGGY